MNEADGAARSEDLTLVGLIEWEKQSEIVGMDSYDDYPDPAKDPKAFMLKAFQNSPLNASIRGVKDKLQDGGLAGAWDDLIKHMAEQLDPMKRGTTPLEERMEHVKIWVGDISERYGEEQTAQMLIRQFERLLKTLALDPDALRHDGNSDPPIDQEFYEFHRKWIVLPTRKDAEAKSADLAKRLTESTIAPEVAQAIKGIQSISNKMAVNHSRLEAYTKVALEKLKQQGLTYAWNEVIDTIVNLRDPFDSSSSNREELRLRISEKLNLMLNQFGARVLEEQLIMRLTAVLDSATTGPTFKRPDYSSGTELNQAFIDLFSNRK